MRPLTIRKMAAEIIAAVGHGKHPEEEEFVAKNISSYFYKFAIDGYYRNFTSGGERAIIILESWRYNIRLITSDEKTIALKKKSHHMVECIEKIMSDYI